MLVNTLFHENNAMKWNIQMQILRANPFVFELDPYRVSNAIYFFYLRFDFTRAKAAHSEILPKPYENEISHNLDNAFLGIVKPEQPQHMQSAKLNI